MPSILVRDYLEGTAQRLPEKEALICRGDRLRYRQIDGMANRLANALIAGGVQRGDRVAVYLGNRIEAVISIFAIVKASAVFVVVNPGTKWDKLRFILNNCHAKAVILDSGSMRSWPDEPMTHLVPSLRALVLCGPDESRNRSAGLSVATFEAVQATASAACPPRRNIDLDLACLIYTSGSTGEPKGVMSDHSNVAFATSSIMEYLENVESDIVIDVLPLSFDYGLYQLLMVFRFGGTLVLEASFTYAGEFMKRIVEERVTGIPGVPTMFSVLVRMEMSKFDLSRVRYLTNTAAALPPGHIREIRQKFPDAKLFSMYGLTETKRTLYLPPEEVDRRPGSVGIPIPGTEAWIEDASGRRLGPDQIGELVVRGRHVMRGYWESPDETQRRFRPGVIPGERVCYTGDLFRQDPDGYFCFVSRMDDIIKSRGEKVAPKEVEHVLYELPGIKEAAVVGVPDPDLGESIKALVVVEAAAGLTAGKILAHCRARLEEFMVPKEVEFREALPVTSSGKISRKELKTKG